MGNIAEHTGDLILIADDDEPTRSLLHRMLAGDGYRVEQAKDGAETIDKYMVCRPSILLVDGFMPQLSGFEVCAFVKRLPEESQIPVIMITALGDQSSINQAFEAGAVDYIPKPIYWPILRHRLRQLISSEHAKKELKAERQLLRTLIDNVPDYIFAKDLEGRFTISNLPHAKAAGVATPDELLGRTALELFPSNVSANFEADDREVMRLGQGIINAERHTVDTTGNPQIVLTTKLPLRDDKGNITGLVGISRDISARKRAEQELADFQDHLEQLVEVRTEELSTVNKNLQAEIRARQMAQSQQQTMMDGLRNVIAVADELMATCDTDMLYRRAVELAREKLGVERCAIFLYRDETLWGTYGTDPLGQTTDEHTAFIPKSDDAQQRFEALGPTQPQWLVKDALHTYWNGHEFDTVGQGWISVSRIRSAQRNIGIFFNDAAISNRPIDPIQQELICVFCSMLATIIERKWVEEDLQRKTVHLSALNEITVGLVRRLDPTEALQLIIQRAGDLVGTLHGYIYEVDRDRQELVTTLGTGIFEKAVGRRLKLGEGLAGKVWETGQLMSVDDYGQWAERQAGYEWLHATACMPLYSGTDIVGVLGLAYTEPDRTFNQEAIETLTRFGELASIALHNAHLYAEIQQELTERKQAEASLRQSEERYRRLFDQIDDTILIYDTDSNLLDVNDAACRHLTYTRDELKQLQVQDIISPEHRHDIASHLAQQFNAEKISRYETVQITRDGIPIDVEENATLITYDGQPAVLSVWRDVTEHRRVEQELRYLNQIKTDFLSTAAHELRTPLVSIRGFSEILLTRELEAPRRERYLRLISEQSTQLGKLLDDLLDISRLESKQQQTLVLESMDMLVTINKVVELFEDVADHPIYVTGLTKCPRIIGDTERLAQVLKNLISNAIKYSPSNSPITICTEVVNDYLQISVQDRGLGLTAEQQNHLFEKFYRADASNTAVGGTGLGLSICKLLIELHNGTLWVQSEYGIGTTFFFTVPILVPIIF